MAGIVSERLLRTLGERLEYWRKKRGFKSRRALSAVTGVSPSAISDLEHGRQKTTTQITALAAALHINPHYLASGEGDPLDTKTLPPIERPQNQLLSLVPERELWDFTDAEIQLVQFKIREAIREVRELRPKRKLSKPA